uniref:Uncharacterized protein n=2 Tax=Physcomitrium patens TaxID=3218 RepID=A0A2K1IKD3_PHYPA|nr:AUGMIN subunit 8-like [Physcomitrium patens]PNR29728.1 hypothetical protein PHYPA_028422 [Physcomitrium patens]|eukprot:XP_024362928.1 AUGMIN subunit 8-like [Physcomitrella patens]
MPVELQHPPLGALRLHTDCGGDVWCSRRCEGEVIDVEALEGEVEGSGRPRRRRGGNVEGDDERRSGAGGVLEWHQERVGVVSSSPPSSVANVQEAKTGKKKEPVNVQNYGGLPPTEKVKLVHKPRTMEITSRYKTATIASPTLTTPASRRPSPLRQSSPSSRQSSPARNRSSSSGSSNGTKGGLESHLRHPSPNTGRSTNAPELTKRAFSTERTRRPWPAVIPSEIKPVSTVSSSVGLASLTKARPQSRGPELWPSMSVVKQSVDTNSESASDRSDCQSEGGKEKDLTNKVSKHTPKSTGSGTVNGNISGSPSRKGSPMRRQSIVQSENARPTENSHSKPDQQRWPGMSTGKILNTSMNRNSDLGVEKERPLARSVAMTTQSRPGTPSSRIKATLSRSYSRSGDSEGPVAPSGQVALRRNPTPTRGGAGTTGSAAREPVINNNCSGNADAAHVSGNGTGATDHATHARRLSQESVATVDSLSTPAETMSDVESVSSAGSVPGSRNVRGTTVPARVWQDTNTRLRRLSEGERNRTSDAADLPAVAIAPVKTFRRMKVLPHQSAVSLLMNQSMNQSMNGSTTSAWALSPGRMSGSVPSTPHPPSSPSHSKGTSPLRRLPSPQRSRPVNVAAAALAGTARSLGSTTLNFGIDGRSRGKKALTQQEEVQLLRILHNRWLQWRFVNSRAEAVMSSQKAAAERQLFNVWVKTSELRTSVAMQRIKLQQARQAHKLRSILSTHATYLENWKTLEEEHSNALTGCMEALESAILRVPMTGGARADVQAIKEALNSAVDVLNAIEGSVHFLLPKTQNMDALLSQLAETAAQERALLEECGDLLSVAASLEVEERSLRTHLIQLENERLRAS